MDIQIVVHLYNRTLLSNQMNELLIYATTWVKLRKEYGLEKYIQRNSECFSNGVENFNLQISEVQFIFKQDTITTF